MHDFSQQHLESSDETGEEDETGEGFGKMLIDGSDSDDIQGGRSSTKETEAESQRSPRSLSSGLTEESIDEEAVRNLISNLLQETLNFLDKDFPKFTWLPVDLGYDLIVGYEVCEMTTKGRCQSMKMKFGPKTISSINDGGLSLMYRIGETQPDFKVNERGKSPWPVLSFEAKRKSSKKINTQKGRETTTVNHAAQILGEMLGQVCQSRLFKKGIRNRL